MPLCQGAVPGWGSEQALGLGVLLVPGRTHSRPPTRAGQAPTEPDGARRAGSVSEKKADLPDTRQADLCGCSSLPALQSGARASPSLGKQKLWALPAVYATGAVRLVLEVAGNDVFRLQQMTFSLVVLFLERSAE